MSESNQMGSWTLIGYVAPGATSAATGDVSTGSNTTNFNYLPGTVTGAAAAGSAAITTSLSNKGWAAQANVALNDCAVDTEWSITVKGNSNGNSVSYEASQAACASALTPTFDKIGK